MAHLLGPKNELVKCEYCGELYSTSYSHCPFCNEDGTGRWDDIEAEIRARTEQAELYTETDAPPQTTSSRGGKRLVGNRHGGYRGPSAGRILLTILSLVFIVAAICIVISIVKPMLIKNPAATDNPDAQASAQVSDANAVEGQPAAPSGEPAPPENNANLPTAFTLNRDDFTFNAAGQIFQMEVSFTPADATADVTWKSSDPNIASVSWNGVVTSVAKGTATLTASVEGVGEQTCIVRCNFEDNAGTPADPNGGGTTANLKLNREDFTLNKSGQTFRMIVSGTSSTVQWESSNPNVATIGADGTVTAVSRGNCTVTATVDGVTLKCIVRCSF